MTSPTPAPDRPACATRILAVDDQDMNLDLLTRRLARLGYLVEPEASPVRALAAALDHPPDLVVLDYMMPEMSGLSMLQELRRHHDQMALPVIMVTARSDPDAVVECLEAGANDFVTKPVSMPVLQARIDAQLDRRRATLALRELNRDLEARIAERTRELVDRNRALGQAFEELQKADKAKSLFLAGVSHELRTPLNAIIGLSELLDKQVVTPADPGRYRQFTAEILRCGTYLLDIVSGILEATSFEKGIDHVTLEPVDLRDLVRECSAMVQSAARSPSPAIRLEICDLPLRVQADHSRLKQALTNILSNAEKFSPERGEILLACRAAGDRAEVEIADQGPGIPAADRAGAMMPFVQLFPDKSVKPEGIGLGLHIADKILQRHGGRMELRGREPTGLSVLLSLPLDR